jgi:hypothetical protein
MIFRLKFNRKTNQFFGGATEEENKSFKAMIHKAFTKGQFAIPKTITESVYDPNTRKRKNVTRTITEERNPFGGRLLAVKVNNDGTLTVPYMSEPIDMKFVRILSPKIKKNKDLENYINRIDKEEKEKNAPKIELKKKNRASFIKRNAETVKKVKDKIFKRRKELELKKKEEEAEKASKLKEDN